LERGLPLIGGRPPAFLCYITGSGPGRFHSVKYDNVPDPASYFRPQSASGHILHLDNVPDPDSGSGIPLPAATCDWACGALYSAMASYRTDQREILLPWGLVTSAFRFALSLCLVMKLYYPVAALRRMGRRDARTPCAYVLVERWG